MRYHPIVRNGETVGYLWASVDDNAASCLRRLAKEEESLHAYRFWDERLKACKAQGLTPLQALRRWAGESSGGEHGRLDAPEREASTADDAASYMHRAAAGDDGFNSSVPWRRALRAALEYGMTPLQALHHAVGTPEDVRAGGIPADTPVSEAPSLAALRSIAQA
ncbi:hypothetical protein BJF79_25445 [Actinomadura sp. CNU-125]|nr:hypothetical protein BJF79_25445 [Actinomadura sp. CNU-125]